MIIITIFFMTMIMTIFIIITTIDHQPPDAMEIVERRTVYIYIEEQNDEKPFFVLLLNNLAPNYDQYLYLSILSCMLTYNQ